MQNEVIGQEAASKLLEQGVTPEALAQHVREYNAAVLGDMTAAPFPGDPRVSLAMSILQLGGQASDLVLPSTRRVVAEVLNAALLQRTINPGAETD